MRIFSDPIALQQEMIALKKRGKTIGFVPTMGNLHAGHLSLIETARKHCDRIVSSIYVNPMQFGPNEDFGSYPRTLQADTEKLQSCDTDILFTPTDNVIYPLGKDLHSTVEVNRMTDKLCGASRPGHFRGVTTVVNILFNIVQPDIAVFGKKDYQQYLLIKAMVKDLMLPVKIIGGEIKREQNGLAMSSRNAYLSAAERDSAAYLRKAIIQASEQFKNGEEITVIKQHAYNLLEKQGFKVDYFELVRQNDLESAVIGDRQILIAAAAWLGKPRLIDNLEINR